MTSKRQIKKRKDSPPAAKIQKKHQTTKFTTENQPQNFNYAKLPEETTDQFPLHYAPIPTPRTPPLRFFRQACIITIGCAHSVLSIPSLNTCISFNPTQKSWGCTGGTAPCSVLILLIKRLNALSTPDNNFLFPKCIILPLLRKSHFFEFDQFGSTVQEFQ